MFWKHQPREIDVFFVNPINNAGEYSFSGLKISGGAANIGGGIEAGTFVQASILISSVEVSQNSATATGGSGGGIYTRLATLTINDSLITNNHSLGSGGGLTSYKVNLNHSTVSFNQANDGFGGGVFATFATVWSSTIDSNTAGGTVYGSGGGICAALGLTAEYSTISNNISKERNGAGIYVGSNGTVGMTGCTVSGNHSLGATSMGGGFYGKVQSLQIENCTFSDNLSGKSGGGLAITTATANALLSVSTSTISGNTSSQAGGISFSATSSAINLMSVIVADNIATGQFSDIYSLAHVNAIDCNITNVAGVLYLTKAGNFISSSPQLGPLADNGGSTLTRLPASGSPVRNAGSNPIGLVNDQRGPGYARQVGSAVDIGAVESSDGIPTATVPIVSTILTPTIDPVLIQVVYGGTSAIDVSTVIGNNSALVVTGPDGTTFPVQFVSIDNPANGLPRTAVYYFTPPGGQFDPADSGTYSVSVQTSQVFDVNGTAVASGKRMDFVVAIPWHFVVTNLNDGPVNAAGDLPGSLRQALFDANVAFTHDSITFDPSLFPAPATLVLTNGVLLILDAVSIAGPGSKHLTINAGGKSGVWNANLSSPRIDQTVEMSGMTITGGVASYGGGLWATGTKLTVTDCSFFGNKAVGPANVSNFGGGAVRAVSGTFIFSNCTFVDNDAGSSRGGALSISGSTFSVLKSTIQNNKGGGIISRGCSNGTIRNSIIIGNSAPGSGGGVYCDQDINNSVVSNLLIEGSTISGNTALIGTVIQTSGGGGVAFRGAAFVAQKAQSGTLTVRNCSILDNVTDSQGGGMFVGGRDVLIMSASTVSGNTASANGGGIYFQYDNGLLIESSTISDNSTTLSSSFKVFGGGGIYFWGTPASIGATIRNCTISGNSAKAAGGGALFYSATGTVRFENCTITNNTATSGGGGIARSTTGSIVISLTNTTAADNFHATSPNILTKGTVTASFSIIGITNGISTLTASNSLTGTLAAPLDAKLAPLANFGGPTLTHALLPGSPAINAGSVIAGITTDQRGYLRTYSSAPDIGAFEAQPPRVAAIVINDGSAQRSRVTSVTVNFDSPVAIIPNAFRLQRQSNGQFVDLLAQISVGTPTTSVLLTFSGAVTEFGSLMDGRYTLTVLGNQITNFVGNLDGNADGVPGDDYVLIGTPANGLFRLFGDSDGDGAVAANDFIQIRLSFASSNAIFDFNGDGYVSANDFLQFRMRFGGNV